MMLLRMMMMMSGMSDLESDMLVHKIIKWERGKFCQVQCIFCGKKLYKLCWCDQAWVCDVKVL